MRRSILTLSLLASLVSAFFLTQATPAHASGTCYWWWRVNGVIRYSYFDCAHPTTPPWEGGPVKSIPPASNPIIPPPASSTSSGPYRNTYTWGFCTWWAAQERLDENLEHLGDAQFWTADAKARGLPTGTVPKVNATAVFQPWVQGAFGGGHVTHVVAVNGSTFEVSEMNFAGGTPKGGFGKVDYRWAHTGPGVSFIY